MKAAFLCSSILILGLSGMAAAECVYPKAPAAIPNGKTASEAEMIEAMTQFKQYNTDVTAYIACLDQETKQRQQSGISVSALIQLKTMQSKKQTAVAEELQDNAAKFNEQVRAFKSRKG